MEGLGVLSMFLPISHVWVLHFSSGCPDAKGTVLSATCHRQASCLPEFKTVNPRLLLEGYVPAAATAPGLRNVFCQRPCSPSPQLPSQSLLSVTRSGGSQVL